MALLKKDKSAKPEATAPEPPAGPAPSEAVAAADEPALPVDTAAPETAVQEAAAPVVLEVPAAPDEPAPGSDDLLNMFEAVGLQQEDRSLLLGMAGDVDIADLVSELNIVAAALGIVMAERDQAATTGVELAAAA